MLIRLMPPIDRVHILADGNVTFCNILLAILSGGDSYIRGDRGAVSEGMLMDQTIRENMSKNRPKIPGKCRQSDQYDRVK